MDSPFLAMSSLQLQLFVLVLVGFILTKLGTVTPAGRKSLTDVLINFILPCNIICSFQLDMTAEILTACGTIFLIACGTQLLFFFSSKVLFHGAPKERLACLRYATICSNAGFLGIPIISGVYPALGTLLTSVALIPQRLIMWSAGISLFSHTEGKGVVKKLLTHPCIVAVEIGFVIMLLGNPTLPGFVQKSLDSANRCTTCMSMIVIGSVLAGAEHINLRDGMLWWFTFARLILIPLAVYLVLTIIPVGDTVRGVMVLISAMPAGSTTAILATRYDGDAQFASCMVSVSTLLSMITLPLLCLLL